MSVISGIRGALAFQMALVHMFPALLPVLLALPWHSQAQAVHCITLAGGCDTGKAGQAALQKATIQFGDGQVYGGPEAEAIVFSTSATDDALAQISYSCNDGSVPPALAGGAIRELQVPQYHFFFSFFFRLFITNEHILGSSAS